MSARPGIHLLSRLIAGGLGLAVLVLAPALTHAQAPGSPISTTVLDPAGPQVAGEAAEAPPGPQPDEAGVPSERGVVPELENRIDSANAASPDSTGTAAPRLITPGVEASRNTAGVDQDTARAADPPTRAAASPAPAEITGQARSTEQVPASPDASPSNTPATTAAREMLSDLWRAAVAAGETTQGFDLWLAELLGPSEGSGANPGRGTAAPPEPPGTQAGRARMASERWLARTGAVALGKAGRVVTTFGAAIPTAVCAPLMVCYIELEPGEILTETPSVGDPVRWQITVKTQGVNAETVLVEVKPSDDAQVTNLVIPTDRRLYSINLVNDPEVHTPILSFLYPDSAARKRAEAQAEREAAEAAAETAAGQRKAAAAAARAVELNRAGVTTSTGPVAADRLDFGFRIDGKAPFRPVRVFADGRKTYIDLHPGYRGAMPVIIAGPNEANKALNTRVAEGGTRLVADRVIADIWLQAGKKRVRIRKAGS